MNQVRPHPIWLGHAGDGEAFRRLFDLGIEAVVQLSAEEPPLSLPRDLILCHFPLIDGVGNRPAVLSLAIETTAAVVRERMPVLICCNAGMSRSPAVAAAALTLAYGGTPEHWLKAVAEHHPSDVSPGLWDEVCRMLVNPRPA
jgi:protein-tyrosine phosphatase